ncbi:MAG: tripartite tricarboxylate transporter permease [Caldilineaceae bacterium]
MDGHALQLLLDGFAVALTPQNLMIAFFGAVIGTFVGMMPGIGPINGIVVLIPLAFAMDLSATQMLILFAGIYYGAEYGNSISAILINVPGTSAAVVTALEGNALARRGRAGPALATSALASFFGSNVTLLAMMVAAPLLARWAIKFGPAEYFALIVFAFSTLSSLAGANLAKGLIATVIGLMISTVGLDVMTGVPRYTFGNLRLYDGLDFVVVVIGFFAVNEVLRLTYDRIEGQNAINTLGRVFVPLREFFSKTGTLIRGAIIGFLVGILPGAGAAIGAFIAYSTEKRISGIKEDLFADTDDIRGVAAPEVANNAAVSGSLIPLLTLGVPGSGTTAVMLGALLGLGITPGPLLIKNTPEIFWGLIAAMYIGNLMLLALNLPLVGIFVRVLNVPDWFLYPSVIAVSFVAVYAATNSTFDMLLMAGIGVLGFFLHMVKLPLQPVILGLILGPLMENNLRRALTISRGDWGYLFVGGPPRYLTQFREAIGAGDLSVLSSLPLICLGLWLLALLSLFLPLLLRRNASGKVVDVPMEGEAP